MNPQGGPYTVTERSGGGAHTGIVGAVKQVLVAPQEYQAGVLRGEYNGRKAKAKKRGT